MTDDNSMDLAAANATLNEKMEQADGPGALVASLQAGYIRLRRNQRLTVVGLLLDFMLTIATIIIVIAVRNNTNHIAANTNGTLISCLAQNEFRTSSHQFWSYLLSTPDGPFTPAQRASIRQQLDPTFALRICEGH